MPDPRAVVDDDEPVVFAEPISSREVRGRVVEVRRGVPLVHVDDWPKEPRAVVASRHRDHCQRMLEQSAGFEGPEWEIARESWRRCITGAQQEILATRAVVAISDDRQWYTILDKKPNRTDGKMYFTIYGWSDFMNSYQWRDIVEDTGQDAWDVLAAFLAGRAG